MCKVQRNRGYIEEFCNGIYSVSTLFFDVCDDDKRHELIKEEINDELPWAKRI